MKIIVSLALVLISLSALVLQTNSYSVAKVKSGAELSIVQEEDALIAISYGKGKKFTVTNNTGKVIDLRELEVVNGIKHEIIPVGKKGPLTLTPGGNQEFNIKGDPKDLNGKTLRINAYWNGGSAQIKSTIPEIK